MVSKYAGSESEITEQMERVIWGTIARFEAQKRRQRKTDLTRVAMVTGAFVLQTIILSGIL